MGTSIVINMQDYVKIYIHHPYSKNLFYKLFHNTNDIALNEKDNKKEVTCSYKNKKLFLVFDSTINDNDDGLHLLDWFETYYEFERTNPDILHNNSSKTHDNVIFESLNEILSSRNNWIVSVLRTEKIYLGEYDNDNVYDYSHHKILEDICKNHRVITDNFYLNDSPFEIKFNHVLTNTFYQWNENIGIYWFYEFKQIFNNLKFNYDIGFSVRNLKPNRVFILTELAKLNNKNIFLQISDFLYYSSKNDSVDIPLDFKELLKYFQINHNSILGKHGFDNLSIVYGGYNHGTDYDLFFRYLSKAKIQILDESWGYYKDNFSTQYLSEKTLGYILSEIPFIPTHSYPLDYLHSNLDINEYPFYREIYNFKFDKNNIITFIKKFIENFDYNYELLKNWTNQVHEKYIEKINSENSLMELIFNNFNTKNTYTKKRLL